MTAFSKTSELWRRRLEDLKKNNLKREMKVLLGPSEPLVKTENGDIVNFCANDYLGFANNETINKKLVASINKWGAGTAASRLVSGNKLAHENLENAMASFLKTSTSVLFVSGYQANVGALSSLTQKGDIIFSDQLAHASLVDGTRLSKADVCIFKHNDMDHLEELLKTYHTDGIKLIVTDAIFSMDGDIAKLDKIVELKEKYNAQIYLDEAHSIGVLGKEGRGLANHLGLEDKIDIKMATFSKAFGICGAIVACNNDAAGLLKSTARSLLYTTAPPAFLAEAILVCLELVKNGDELRDKLQKNIKLFKDMSDSYNLPIINSNTPIQAVMTKDNARTMKISNKLLERGFFAQGIRPPTVPEGMSRLRVTLNAKHTSNQIASFVLAIDKTLKEIKA